MPRQVTVRPQAEHEALQQARLYQQTEAFHFPLSVVLTARPGSECLTERTQNPAELLRPASQVRPTKAFPGNNSSMLTG